MKIKVCGMKYGDNMLSVAGLKPDYMGFIFYKGSRRNFSGDLPDMDPSIKKTGVFVNESHAEIVKKVKKYELQAIQLHGDETSDFCSEMKDELNSDLEIIKVFSIADESDFDDLDAYNESCDYFLFDTKGKERGGNGTLFNWAVLNKIKHSKKYFLSGGIGLEESKMVREFLNTEAGQYCYAIDLHSRFESEPGIKNIEQLETFFRIIKE